jgi:transposase
MGNKGQVGYPSDVSDEEWAFVAPYLALCREDAPQRSHSLRSVFNALRWLVKTGAHWRMMPNDLPPWPVVYQQTRRWIRAGCFEIMVEDLRSLPLYSQNFLHSSFNTMCYSLPIMLKC